MVVDLDGEVCSREGVLASRQFEKHDAERPNVTWIRVVETLKSFRRHVAQSSSVGTRVLIHGWTVVSISKLLADSKVAQLCDTKRRFH